MLELEKNEKSKIRGGGGICAPRAQHGRVPMILIYKKFVTKLLYFGCPSVI